MEETRRVTGFTDEDTNSTVYQEDDLEVDVLVTNVRAEDPAEPDAEPVPVDLLDFSGSVVDTYVVSALPPGSSKIIQLVWDFPLFYEGVDDITVESPHDFEDKTVVLASSYSDNIEEEVFEEGSSFVGLFYVEMSSGTDEVHNLIMAELEDNFDEGQEDEFIGDLEYDRNEIYYEDGILDWTHSEANVGGFMIRISSSKEELFDEAIGKVKDEFELGWKEEFFDSIHDRAQ